ncbi:MAG: DUF2207 domain-containing protein [Proteobacteria bacterium]|nr:DUF2207 domain-containing protein [Pseudomonadota bacterium]MBU1059034.1 DUF2207 domain-containing protein [Pseudomonadota bacterium]
MTAVFRLFLLCIFFLPCTGEARSLFWDDMEVRASLDGEGRLHIREQQTMVFSGSWNGGERDFHVRPGQDMQFEGISRLGEGGREIPLVRGGMQEVDHWDHNGETAIRWRSRLPSDPAFANTKITYVLYYSLGHILLSDKEGYLLNHDFCFPDRSGVVKNFRLDLTFDPVWQSGPVSMVARDITPGQGVVLRQQLHFSGQGTPSIFQEPPPLPSSIPPAPVSPAPVWLRIILLVAFVGGILWRIRLFFQWENSLGRFVAVEPAENIDQHWLEQELFVYKPEVVGATWDKKTSTAEVAAVLARLVQEGKMESWLEPYRFPFLNFPIPGMPPVLHLKLLQSRNAFLGYEQKLIEGLFVNKSRTTDTKTIRNYYQKKQKTFDPVSKIQESLQRQMKRLTGEGEHSLAMLWVPTVGLAVGGFFLLLINSFLHQEEFVALEIFAVLIVACCWVGGIINALRYRNSVIALAWRFSVVLFVVGSLSAVFFVLLLLASSTLLLLGVFCLAAASSNNIINLARSRESAEGLALRRRLAAARNYFKQELVREKPDISDSWFPYLLAFGLGPKVDSWFRRHGRPGETPLGATAGSSASGFTGGGGAFGGGGASGSWSTAVGSLAASSGGSSGGSGGSGGGGSSGGGGGGGW